MRRIFLACCLLTAATVSCGEPTRPATIVLAASAPTVSLVHGGSATVTLTVSRSNFTGPVQLAVDGLPSGVTAALAPAMLADPAGSSVLTLSAATTAATGTHALTIRASGDGVPPQTATLTLNISGAFTFGAATASVTVLQGDTAVSKVGLVRTGSFAPEVSLAVTGAPAGMSAVITPAAANASEATLQIGTGPTTPAGIHVLTVRGSAPGVPDQALAITVTVVMVNATPVTFGLCSPYVTWVGYQNSGGAWAPATRVSEHTYTFTLSTMRGGVAWVEQAGGSPSVTMVEYATAAELAARGDTLVADCAAGADPFDKALEGEVSTIPTGHHGNVSLGRAGAFVLPGDSRYWLNGVPRGPRDLVATRSIRPNYTVDRIIVRRNLDVATGSVLPRLDFDGVEAIAPAAATITYTGYGNDLGQVSSILRTANGSTAHFGYNSVFDFSTGEAAYLGLPSSHLADGDVQVVSTQLISRFLEASFRHVADYTVAFGPVLGPASLGTVAGSSPLRLRLEVPVQPEYRTAFAHFYGSNDVRVRMTAAYRGAAATWGLPIPDFGATSGYQPAWGLQTGVAHAWRLRVWGDYTSMPLRVIRGATQESGGAGAAPSAGAYGARSRQ